MEESRELSDPMALLIRAKGAGRGSGFFVGKNLIATNIHVVAAATSISVEVLGTTNAKFEIIGVTAFDPKNDLVILKIAGEGTPLPIGDSCLLQSGDIVRAICYPSGKYEVTEGPVHGILHNNKWIRMKVRTSDGSSGGPVLNRDSEVIGIVISGEPSYSHAIPGSILKMLLDQAKAIEPLAQWQEREQIRGYACLAQSKKHKTNNDDEKMISDLDKAIQLNPDFFLSWFTRGNIKVCLGRSKVGDSNVPVAQQHYREAVADYTQAIKLCPDYVDSHIGRGNAQSCLGQSKVEEGDMVEARQHYQDAIDDHTEAIKLCSDYNIVYNNRADAKCHFGKSEDAAGNIEAAQNLYQAALIDVNTAIELDSDVALFYHTRGEIMHALGDYSVAIENYEKSREIDTDYTDVCKDLELAKKALERVKGGQTGD